MEYASAHRITWFTLRMLCAVLTMGGACLAATAELRPLVTAQNAGPNLLRADGWRALVPDRGSRAQGTFTIDNAQDATAASGFHQSLRLDQTRPMPLIAEVESRALDVGGQANPDYSLYLDIIYTDGSPLWGKVATFPTGTSDWQRRQVVILPEKPIRSVEFYLLLRRHAGKAEFRNPILAQATANEVAVFDGLLVRGTQVDSPQFMVRNVGTNTGFTSASPTFPVGTTSPSPILPRTRRATTGIAPGMTDADFLQPRSFTWRGAPRPGEPGDKALTIAYVLPLPPGLWKWLHDPQTAIAPTVHQDLLNTLPCPAGARSLLSRYPFAAVSDGARGVALAIDLAAPAIYRAGYASDTRELYIACDIATTPEQRSLSLTVQPFDFDGRGGFRAALAKYYLLHPEPFRVRVKRQGLWMPFAAISKVENWQDFGFAFKEGNDETQWDDQHDILTFHYTEPLTWWMALPPDAPRTYEAALAHARTLADGHDAQAQSLFTSAYHNTAGQVAGRFQKQPWCDGIVWSMNSAPGLPRPNDFDNKWSPSLRDSLYGTRATERGRLDGEYIDSSEGYITDELDFNRAHFAAMQTPLTFDPATHRPAIFRGLIAFEYIRAIARDVHNMDLFMMANATPQALPWLAPMLDVMGSETDWNPGGKWQPMSVEELLYRRALCGSKPFCFLMNTNFDQFPPELVEKYMQRCLAFGMFPGFFSHNAAEKQYFTNPALYNRDRPLFQKYIPLCRTIAEAGWRPITLASSANPAIHLERFGDRYLTALNTSDQPQRAAIKLAWLKPPKTCTARPADQPIPIRDSSVELELAPEQAVVLDLQ